MELFLAALARLPLSWLYRVGSVLAFVAHRVLRWRCELALGNLARSFPELSPEERERILGACYRNLGQLLAEILWSRRATKAEIAARVTVENPDLINAETRSGRPVLLMTAHFCNWEWQVLAGNLVLDAPMYPVYKPQRLKSVDEFLRLTRARFGGEPIPHKELTRRLLRSRSEPRVYALVADQTPTPDEPKHWTSFLHQPTAFFVGADAIARILKAPVLFVKMRRVARGHYVMRVSRLADPPYRSRSGTGVIEAYARELEDEIRANPADWLWIHRKWKYSPPPAGRAVAAVED